MTSQVQIDAELASLNLGGATLASVVMPSGDAVGRVWLVDHLEGDTGRGVGWDDSAKTLLAIEATGKRVCWAPGSGAVRALIKLAPRLDGRVPDETDRD